MPGGSLQIGESRGAVGCSVKKERPGYEWGPRWGADGSSSPAFAWGQTLLSRGRRLSAHHYLKQTLCLEKPAINQEVRDQVFSLSATWDTSKSRNRPPFRENSDFCKLRRIPLDAITLRSHPG